MNLHHLKIFHAIAETGNITRAAEKLETAQPAVSRQLALLEKSLNTKLVDRLPRGIRLTQSGQLLATYASRLFSIESEAHRALAELQGLHRGTLLLGASLTIGSHLLPPLIAAFHQYHPHIQVTLHIANTDEIHRRLLASQLDLGFTEGLLPSDDLAATIFATDELLPVVPPTHPLLAMNHPPPKAFAKYPLILREPGSGTRAIVERALRKAGTTANPALSLGSAEAIKSALLANAGVAILSKLAVAPELRAGQLATLPIPALHIRRDLYHLHPRGLTPSHAATTFLALLHQHSSTSRRATKTG